MPESRNRLSPVLPRDAAQAGCFRQQPFATRFKCKPCVPNIPFVRQTIRRHQPTNQRGCDVPKRNLLRCESLSRPQEKPPPKARRLLLWRGVRRRCHEERNSSASVDMTISTVYIRTCGRSPGHRCAVSSAYVGCGSTVGGVSRSRAHRSSWQGLRTRPSQKPAAFGGGFCFDGSATIHTQAVNASDVHPRWFVGLIRRICLSTTLISSRKACTCKTSGRTVFAETPS